MKIVSHTVTEPASSPGTRFYSLPYGSRVLTMDGNKLITIEDQFAIGPSADFVITFVQVGDENNDAYHENYLGKAVFPSTNEYYAFM